MTMLVAGSSGFIGSDVANRLESEGHDVLRTAREAAADVRGDLALPETLLNLKGVDTIVHFAGDVSVRKYIENPGAFAMNLEITRNLLEFARLNDVKLFLFASTDRVYGPAKGRVNEKMPAAPRELYAACKLAGEALCCAYAQTYGIGVITLRIANVYGPGQKPELFIPSVIRQAIDGDTVKVGNIDVYRNFVYVKDVSSACATMLKNKASRNSVINIAESSSSLRSVINTVAKIKKKHMKKTLKLKRDNALVRPQSTETGRFALDCSKAHSLGWEPEYSMERGLEEAFLHALGGKNKG